MTRFTTTLCLSSLRTADNARYVVQDKGHVLVGEALLEVDEVVPRALPSQVAGVLKRKIEDAPSFSHSVCLLLGSATRNGRFGDAVVDSVVRQLTSEQSSAQYESCILFANDGNSVICESLSAQDSLAAIRNRLSSLHDISFAIFKFQYKTCALLLTDRLTPAHMAAMFCSSFRHVLLVIDDQITSREVCTTVEEMNTVRYTIKGALRPSVQLSAVSPLPPPAPHEGREQAPSLGLLLHSLALSEEQFHLLMDIAEREGWTSALATRHPSPSGGVSGRSLYREPSHSQLRVEEVQELQRAVAQLQQDKARLEAERDAARQLRSDAAHGGPDITTPFINRLASADQSQLGGRLPSEVEKLQAALQEAQKARQFAEEKLHLLEFRQSLPLRGSPSPPSQGRAAAAPASGSIQMELQLAQKENVALVSEFLKKEKAWQESMQEADGEIARLRRQNEEMQRTLELQAKTIRQAKKEIESQKNREKDVAVVLRKVRALSESSTTPRNQSPQGGGESARRPQDSVSRRPVTLRDPLISPKRDAQASVTSPKR